jgi:phosphoglycolate phosphatase-like HAD superfamily hydrolase
MSNELSKLSFKGVGFDFDGVLLDSYACMETSWLATSSNFDLKIPFESYAQLVGLPFPNILENLVIPESIRSSVTRFYFDSTLRNQSMITSFVGAKSLLQLIKKSGKSVFLITSRSRASTERFLNDFQLKFDCVVAGDDLECGKPDVMPGQLALSKLGLKSDEVVYIGDAQSDFQFAEALDWKFIFANYGFGKLDGSGRPFAEISKIGQIAEIVLLDKRGETID